MAANSWTAHIITSGEADDETVGADDPGVADPLWLGDTEARTLACLGTL